MTKNNLSSQHILAKADRLAKTVRSCGFKQSELASLAGCSPQTINKLTRGHQNLNADWARKLSKILNVTESFLLLETDENYGSHNHICEHPENDQMQCVPIPTLSVSAGAGGGKILDAEPSVWGEEAFFDKKLILDNLKVSKQHLCAVTIEGQSMEPILNNGDIVLVNILKNDVAEPGIFVLFDGDGIVCKWVERIVGSDPAQYRIKSENIRFSEYSVLADTAKIIGRVVWFGRTL